MADELKADLDALGRLSKQLKALSDKVSASAAKPAGSVSGDSPSAVAAQQVSTQVVPGVQKMVAGRISAVADLAAQTATEFGDTEEHVRASLASMGTLAPAGSR